MLEISGAIERISKREIKQIKDKKSEASMRLDQALILEILNYPAAEIDIAFANALAVDSKCFDVYAHKAGRLRTSDAPDMKKAYAEAKSATGAKILLSQPKSESKLQDAIKGVKSALSKSDDVSLLGIYQQLVLEKASLLAKVKEGKKDTEVKKSLIEDAFKAAMQLIVESSAKNLHDLEAQAYAVSWTIGTEAMDDKFIQISKMPEYQDSFRAYILAISSTDDPAEIEHCYREAVRCEPNYAKGHYELGLIHYNRHELPEAESHFRKVVSIDNHHVEAMLYAMVVTGMQGKYEDSVKYADMVLKANPTIEKASQAHHGLTIAYQKQGNFAQALKYANKALELEPNDILYLCSKAELLSSQGPDAARDREALALVNKAHSLYEAKKLDGTLEDLSPQNKNFVSWAFNTQRADLLKAVNELEELQTDTSSILGEVLESNKADMLDQVLASMNNQSEDTGQMQGLQMMVSAMQEMFGQMRQMQAQLDTVTKVKAMKTEVAKDPAIYGWYTAFVKTLESEFVEANLLAKSGAKLAADSSSWTVSALAGMASALPFGSFVSSAVEALASELIEASATRKAVKMAKLAPTIVDFDDLISLAALSVATQKTGILKSHIADKAVVEGSSSIFGKIKGYCEKAYGKYKGVLWNTAPEKVGAADALAIIHAVEKAQTTHSAFDLFSSQLTALVSNEGGCAHNELALMGWAFEKLSHHEI